MATSKEPTALLSTLSRANGSATFSQNGYSVIGSVNGPIEVTRRDELPEEAAVEVIVRPANGPGGTRERHLESILQSTLRQVILIHNFPRTLIQITLQIISTPQSGTIGTKLLQPSSNLPVLPALLQTANLALLAGSIPLSMTLSSVLIAFNNTTTPNKAVQHPTVDAIQKASSVHVLGFTSNGDLLVVESEGIFSIEEWDEVYDTGKHICCGGLTSSDSEMQEDHGDASENMQYFARSAIQAKVESDLHWKN